MMWYRRYGFHDLVNVGVVGNIQKWLGAGDDPSCFGNKGKVTQGFEGFDGDDDVGLPERDQVGCDLIVRNAEI